MKLEIKYSLEMNCTPPFFAVVTGLRDAQAASGTSWEDAKKNVLEKVQKYLAVNIPQNETVEI